MRCLELSSQNNRLICVSPGLRSSISGGPRAFSSLQSSKSGEARAYPSVMAPPPVSAIFHEKFQTFCFILNYSLQIYFAISLENLCYIKIPDRTESWLSCLRKHARFPTILLRSISHRKLRKHRLVVRRRPSGAPLTASRFHVSTCSLQVISLFHKP